MIIGIGSDIIDIRRIERTLERFGRRFIDRVYTEVEQRKSEGRSLRAASYAKRFADGIAGPTQIRSLVGAGHRADLDAPRVTAESVLSFLAS